MSATEHYKRERDAACALVAVLLEGASDGVFVTDRRGTVVGSNDALAQLLRYDHARLPMVGDELLSGLVSQLVDPDRFLDHLESLRRRPFDTMNEEVATRDGRRLEVRTVPVRAAPGHHGGRVWFLRDISAALRAREELDKANAFLDTILDNIPDMIFVKDAFNLTFERINRAGEQMLGVQRDEVLGRSDRDLFPPEQAEFFEQDDRATLASGVMLDIPEDPLLTAQGARWMHTKKIPIHDAHGVPKYLLGISADITERKLAQEILERANEELERRVNERTAELSTTNAELTQEAAERERAQAALRRTEEQLRIAQKLEAVGRLAGGVAHDFNNMLAVVVGCSEMLLEQVSPDSPLREDIEQIHEAARRSAALTQQLLAFSRQQVLQPVVLDINGVVADMQKMLRRLIGEDVECSTELDPSVGTIEVDPGQMQQVLMNLAVNARDAMPGGGRMLIATSTVHLAGAEVAEAGIGESREHVCLTVQDTGMGMDAETQARIFEPFFTTKEQGRGTGLGLATVYGIVRQSGGQITVDSQPGRGTSFRIFFPVIHKPVLSTVPSERSRRGGCETILLVEDEELVRRAASRILRRGGYQVLDACGPAQAVQLSAQHAPNIDLVLTDVVMPGMNGFQLTRQLAELRHDLRVLFMSGYTDAAILENGEVPPDAPFLQKPFSPAVLLRKVREVLDMSVSGPASATPA